MPIFYLGLIIAMISIFFIINESQHETTYNHSDIDGVTLNQSFSQENSLYKQASIDSIEYLTISDLLEEKGFVLQAKKTQLQDLDKPYSFYSASPDGNVKSLGYFGYSESDCIKLRAISVSNLGKHHMSINDNGISEILSWESSDYSFIYTNKYLSDGIEINSFCSYVVSGR